MRSVARGAAGGMIVLTRPLLRRRLSLFLLLAFATLQVLIALQLDGTIDTSYFVVLAPWLLIEAVILVTRAASLKSTCVAQPAP